MGWVTYQLSRIYPAMHMNIMAKFVASQFQLLLLADRHGVCEMSWGSESLSLRACGQGGCWKSNSSPVHILEKYSVV